MTRSRFNANAAQPGLKRPEAPALKSPVPRKALSLSECKFATVWRMLPAVVLAAWTLMPAKMHADDVRDADVRDADVRAADVRADDVRDAAEVQTTVHEVLTDSEYRHLFRDERKADGDDQLSNWLQRFFEWLFGSEERQLGISEPALDLSQILFYIAIAVLAALLIAMLISLRKRMEAAQLEQPLLQGSGEEAINPSSPPGDVPTNEYERRALIAAEASDFRTALRELVLGSMSWTERAGLIRHRRGLSNRDYVRAVWRRLQQRNSLLHIVASFERVFYGRRVADATTFQSCLKEFRRSFLMEETDANLAG
jgi:hypothetical protein